MVDALVKVRYKAKDIGISELGQEARNLGIWTFVELPRVGESLMLWDAMAESGIKDDGYTGWKVAEIYHIPVRHRVEYPSICIFVDYGNNNACMNLPPAKHHGCGLVPLDR